MCPVLGTHPLCTCPAQGLSDNKIRSSGAVVHEAFQSKNVSGWSLPLSDRDAMVHYAATIDSLYRFYARANEDLYGLMRSLGPALGWTGTFPTAYAPRQDRAS